MQIDIIFKIAGIGFIVAVLSIILKKSDRDDMATMVALAGIIVVLMLVENMVNDFFGTVKTMYGMY